MIEPLDEDQKKHFIELWLDDELNQAIMEDYEDENILLELEYDLESYAIYDYPVCLLSELLVMAKEKFNDL